MTAWAEAPLVQVRGMLKVRWPLISYNAWISFDDTPSGQSDGTMGSSDYAVYDVGLPLAVEKLGVVLRNNSFGPPRAKNIDVYGSNDPDSFSTLVFQNSGVTLPIGMVTNWFERLDSPSAAYRYYKVSSSSAAGNWNFHVMFFSSELQVTQNRCEVLSASAAGGGDLANGVAFDGTLVAVPDGGTADVELLIAASDHGDDYAAWTADATLVLRKSEGLSAGAKYAFDVTGLATGRWYARVFATQGEKHRASQTSAAFAVGTSLYTPTAYFAASTYADNYKAYDGNLSTLPDNSAASGWIVFPLEDINREVAMVRLWPRPNWEIRSLATYWHVTTNAVDLGATSVYDKVTGRTLKYAETCTADNWTLFLRSQDADCFVKSDLKYFEYSVSLPYRHARYLKFAGMVNMNFYEVELRTLPRQAEPEATVALGTVGGSYVGLSGFLDYRGNAASDCAVYASCVKAGDPESFVKIHEAWSNETAWAGSIGGLDALTEYNLKIIVSNALAGVDALSTSFTTTEARVEPPALELTSVTPNDDGTVSFDWKLFFAGSDAASVTVYARWGADADHLGEAVALASGVVVGTGSAATDKVPCGESLVFVLYAVNDQSVASAETASIAAVTQGPSTLGTTTYGRNVASGQTIAVSGSISTIGLGTTKIYLNYGTDAEQMNRFIEVATFDKASASRAFAANIALSERGICYYRVVVSNGWNSSSWLSSTDSKVMVSGVIMPCRVSAANGAVTVRKLTDGAIGEMHDDNGPYTLDLGSPKRLLGAFVVPRSDGMFTGNLKTLKVLLSTDGENWTTGWENANALQPSGGAYFELPFAAEAPRARYVRFRCANEGDLMSLTEIGAIGDGLIVKSEVPRAWGAATSPATDANEPMAGVRFSGMLLSGGPARVYFCASRRDHGVDPDAWLSAECVKDLGEFATGDAIAADVRLPDAAVYRTRLVAVAGDEKATSAEDDFAVSRSKRFETPMYLIADSYSNTSKQVYDDILSNRPDINATHSFVFPLTGSESRVISSVRLWPRNDWTAALYGRTIYARVEMTAEDAALELTDLASSPHVVKTFASDVTTGWVTVGDTTCLARPKYTDPCWEIPIVSPVKGAKFLRVAGVGNDNINEIEIRYVKRSGVVLVFK